MTPIDILIKSGLDPKGFDQAKEAVHALTESIKTGFGIEIGEKITEAIEEIPAKLKEAAAEGIKFNAVLQDESARFETLIGNVQEASARIQELVEFSDENPIFSFEEVANANAFLQVVTKGGLAGKDALKLIGDAAAAGHVGIDQMAEVIGRLYAGLEEGLPVEHATMRLLQMGLISGDTARHLNDVAASGFGMGRAMDVIQSTFAKTQGAMEKQSHTLNGEIKALKSNMESLAGFMTGDFTKALTEALGKINKLLGEDGKSGLTILSKFIDSAGMGGMNVPGLPRTSYSIKQGFGNLHAADADSVPIEEKTLPLTDQQKQLKDELDKRLLESHQSFLTERQKLDEEFDQRRNQIEIEFGNNSKARADALLANEQDRTQRLALLDEQETKEAEEKKEEAAKEFADLQKQLDEEDQKREQKRVEKQQIQMQADKDALRIKLDDISLASAKLDADFTHTETEKRQARIKLIQDEIDAIDTLIKKLVQERELEKDPSAKQALNQQITQLAGEKRAAQAKLVPFTDGANPESFTDQWSKSLAQLRSEWGTLASQIGDTFRNNVNSAISSTSSELARAIVLTGDFDAALKNIAVTILTDIIQAIIQMGIRWIVTQIMMSVAGKSIQAGMVASNAPIAAAASALWATPATLATIASYGAAAAAAPEFIFASEALTLSGSLLSAKEGGYTGDGDPNQVAGIMHRGEYVFTAPQTRAIGRGNLARLAQTVGSGNGAVGAALASGMGGGGARVDNSVKIAPVMHPDMVAQWAQSESGKKFIVDIARGVVLEMQN